MMPINGSEACYSYDANEGAAQLHSHFTALLPHCSHYTVRTAEGGPFIPTVDLLLVGALGIQE